MQAFHGLYLLAKTYDPQSIEVTVLMEAMEMLSESHEKIRLLEEYRKVAQRYLLACKNGETVTIADEKYLLAGVQ